MSRTKSPLLFWIVMICGALYAQTDRTVGVRMLDSKTGEPITTSEFQVWVSASSTPGQTGGTLFRWIRPEADGEGKITLSPDSSLITVHAQYGKAGWGYVNCDRLKDHGPFREHWYSASEILTTGIAAPNYGSKQKAIAKPGEFVFFVRPQTWSEKMQQ